MFKEETYSNNWMSVIDPGKNGGVILRNFDGNILSVHKMPATNRDLVDLFHSHLEISSTKKIYCFIEKVGARPMQSAVASWTFAENYGVLKGITSALKVPTEFILPNTWQKFLGCQTKGDKKITYRKAQEMFPEQKITHWNADALLMSEYVLRRFQKGELNESN